MSALSLHKCKHKKNFLLFIRLLPIFEKIGDSQVHIRLYLICHICGKNRLLGTGEPHLSFIHQIEGLCHIIAYPM